MSFSSSSHLRPFSFTCRLELDSYRQSMIMNKFDLSLVGKPEDVGMKTGATIHTMNGLNMLVSLRSETDPIPATNDWWANQHLTRGFNVNGRPYSTTEDAAWTTSSRRRSN
jgi:hypothetical protein